MGFTEALVTKPGEDGRQAVESDLIAETIANHST